MQKPWSFKAIEFIIYVQIGLTFCVSSSGILSLIARELRQVNRDIPWLLYQFERFWEFWSWLLIQIEYIGLETGKVIGSPDIRLGIALTFFFEFILSSTILFVLKKKSLVVIRTTAILALVLRIVTTPFLVSFFIFTHIFVPSSILIVALLFLKPVQHYIQVRSH